MPAVYQAANLLILPSRGPGETWGLAINEAMACGLPIVASNRVGSARDLVVHEKNGWIFKADNEDSLVQTLLDVEKCTCLDLSQMGIQSQNSIANWSNARQIVGIRSAFALPN
jgi:glycosyltransferase involved in cell wall biosynthesis